MPYKVIKTESFRPEPPAHLSSNPIFSPFYGVVKSAGAYPGGFRSAKRLGASQGYPSIKFAGTHLHTWMERGTVRVKGLAQHKGYGSNPTVRPGVDRTNHAATAPLPSIAWPQIKILVLARPRKQHAT